MLWRDGSNLTLDRSIWARQEWKHSLRRGCLLLTLDECVISKVHSNPLAMNGFYPSKKHEETAVSLSTHLCLQCWGRHDVQYVNEISCVSVCSCQSVWAVSHLGLTQKCLKRRGRLESALLIPCVGIFHIIYDAMIKLAWIKTCSRSECHP